MIYQMFYFLFYYDIFAELECRVAFGNDVDVAEAYILDWHFR